MYPNCKLKITSLQSRKHIVLSLSPTGATKGPGVMSSYQCLLCLGGAIRSWWHITFFQHVSFLCNLYTNCWAFSKPHRVTLSLLISGSHFLLTLPNCSYIHTNWPTPSWTPELLTQGNRFSWWVTIYHLDWVISDLELTCYSMFSILLFHVLLGHWSIDYLPPLAWANSCSLVNFLCIWHFNK